MMKPTHNFFRTFTLVGALAFLASPGFALQVLEDEELDKLSAAGDPVVLESEGAKGSKVAYVDSSVFELDFSVPRAQDGLRALTIQNVVGELQLMTNLNVLSANGNVAGTDQRNFSAQSWGSTLPDPDTVKTATAYAEAAPCQGNGACAGGSGLIGGNSPGIIAGDAEAVVAISPAASASADVIVRSESSEGTSEAAISNNAQFKLKFSESEAQKDLSALFFSNVVGRAQMALNLNIASGGLGLIPGSQDTFANPISGDTTGVVKQVNTGIQFRGTPMVASTGTTGSFDTSIAHANR
ncbi:MAG: hypothetical protein KC592_08805 [Nitrospira sp.]|nr:hypothetical protein [Nitrospira sp.]